MHNPISRIVFTVILCVAFVGLMWLLLAYDQQTLAGELLKSILLIVSGAGAGAGYGRWRKDRTSETTAPEAK